jgi:hypothetical protein
MDIRVPHAVHSGLCLPRQKQSTLRVPCLNETTARWCAFPERDDITYLLPFPYEKRQLPPAAPGSSARGHVVPGLIPVPQREREWQLQQWPTRMLAI